MFYRIWLRIGFLQGLVFVLLIAHEQLITIGRMRDYQLHPADIHLLMNLVVSNRSFRLHHFFPICLPRFDDRWVNEVAWSFGMPLMRQLLNSVLYWLVYDTFRSTFQAHISYLNDSCPACLLMLTVERSEEEFRALFAIQEKLLEVQLQSLYALILHGYVVELLHITLWTITVVGGT